MNNIRSREDNLEEKLNRAEIVLREEKYKAERTI